MVGDVHTTLFTLRLGNSRKPHLSIIQYLRPYVGIVLKYIVYPSHSPDTHWLNVPDKCIGLIVGDNANIITPNHNLPVIISVFFGRFLKQTYQNPTKSQY